MSKIYEDVWIDGKKHTIAREKTAEERRSELDARVAQVSGERVERAVRIAKAKGHSFPTDDDFAEARRQMNKDSNESIVFLAVMILAIVFFLGSCAQACSF